MSTVLSGLSSTLTSRRQLDHWKTNQPLLTLLASCSKISSLLLQPCSCQIRLQLQPRAAWSLGGPIRPLASLQQRLTPHHRMLHSTRGRLCSMVGRLRLQPHLS